MADATSEQLQLASATTLLSWMWIALVIETDNAFEVASRRWIGRRFRISYSVWANGLRLIDDAGLSVAELHARAGARCNVPGLERWGWISIVDESAGAGRRVGFGTQRGIRPGSMLRPTTAGAEARRLWPEVVETVEQRWTKRFGREPIDGLRDLLVRATAMPWSLPEVHPPHGFFTRDVRSAEPPAQPPAMVARLGQTLTALTLRHERGARASLPVAANLLRVLAKDDAGPQHIRARAGLSREAVAMGIAHLQRRGLASTREGGGLRLTADGEAALLDYRDRASVDLQTVRAAVTSLLQHRVKLAEALTPPEGSWRMTAPYIRQTRSRIDDPLGTLPWHPMVLHRGGWPDGS